MVVEPTHLKNMLVKLDNFPRVRGENPKMFELPPPRMILTILDPIGMILQVGFSWKISESRICIWKMRPEFWVTQKAQSTSNRGQWWWIPLGKRKQPPEKQIQVPSTSSEACPFLFLQLGVFSAGPYSPSFVHVVFFQNSRSLGGEDSLSS